MNIFWIILHFMLSYSDVTNGQEVYVSSTNGTNGYTGQMTNCSWPENVDSAATYNSIAAALQSQNISTAWLPIRKKDLKGWAWIDNVFYGKYLSDTPSAVKQGEDCAILRSIDQAFVEVYCDKTYSHYMCQMNGDCKHIKHEICFNTSESYYVVFKERVTWYKANENCNANNGQLAIIRGKDKLSLLKTVALPTKKIWIGLRRKDYFVETQGQGSTTGEKRISKYFWKPKGPSWSLPDKTCVVMTKSNASGYFHWSPEDCKSWHPYICTTVSEIATVHSKRDEVGEGISTGVMLAAILIPSLVVCGICIACFFLLKKRRRIRRQKYNDEKLDKEMIGNILETDIEPIADSRPSLDSETKPKDSIQEPCQKPKAENVSIKTLSEISEQEGIPDYPSTKPQPPEPEPQKPPPQPGPTPSKILNAEEDISKPLEKDFREDADLLPEAYKIRRKLKQGIPRKCLNVIVIGIRGAGKSSLINSLVTAIDELGWHEWANTGIGKGSITPGFIPTTLFSTQSYKGRDEAEYKCKLTFWDFPGLENQDERRILKYLLAGAIDKGTKLPEMRKWYSISAPFDYKWLDATTVDEKMHLAIYVQPADTPFSKQLADSLHDVAQSLYTGSNDISLLIVITKVDKMKDDMEGVNKLMEDVKHRFNMKDTTNKAFKVSSYTNYTALDKNEQIKRRTFIDKDMCKIWNAIVDDAKYTQFEA